MDTLGLVLGDISIISKYCDINQHDNHIVRKVLLTIFSKDRYCRAIELYNNLVFVMQLCLFVIATQVYTCYMNNQLLQKENIPEKDRQRSGKHEQAFH